MKKKIAGVGILFLVLLSMCAVFVACGETEKEEVLIGVFFDSTAEDGGVGTQSKPYNDLDELLDIELIDVDGYNIYLKRGSDFKQNLNLIGLSGTEDRTLYVTDYGDESDPMPKVDGNDSTGSGVLFMRNCEYITVSNIELYDSFDGSDDLVGKDKRGVMLISGNLPDDYVDGDEIEDETIKFYQDITFDNLYIHDIRGVTDYLDNGSSSLSKSCGGICVFTEDPYTSYENLSITNCDIENVDNVGISTVRGQNQSKKAPYASYAYTDGCSYDPYDSIDEGDEWDFTDYALKNVYIANNTIHNIGKNAIFLRAAYDSLIEHNTVYDTATRCYTGNQIVTRSVYCVTVQYNEGYLNNARLNDNEGSKVNKTMDGCMLDPDLLSRDTIWQYNYSHDNAFGLLLNCTGTGYSASSSEDKVIVRNNLSVNDHGDKGLIYVNYSAKNMEVYNNTFITAEDTNYIWQTQDSGDSRVFNFYNNVVYNRSPNAKIDLNYSKGSASNNLIYSATGGSISGLSTFQNNNTNGVYDDPMLKLGVGETLEERTGYTVENLSVAIPLEGSPVFEAGCDILEVAMGDDGDYVPEIETDIAGRAYSCYTLGCVSSSD